MLLEFIAELLVPFASFELHFGIWGSMGMGRVWGSGLVLGSWEGGGAGITPSTEVSLRKMGCFSQPLDAYGPVAHWVGGSQVHW